MKTLTSSEPSSSPGSLAEPGAITDFLLYRFHKVLATAGSRVTRICELEFGVTRREWGVLAVLAAHGPIGSAELARHAQLDRPTTSKAVGGLVAKSLVHRKTRAGDARFNELALSERGVGLYRRMFPAIRKVSLDLLSPLAAKEVAQLDSMLIRIEQHARQAAQQDSKPLGIPRRGGRAARSESNGLIPMSRTKIALR